MISYSVVNAIAVLLLAAAPTASTQGITIYGKCTTPNGDDASCIHLEQCTYLYNMLLSPPLKREDQLFLSRSQCGANNGSVLICCPDRHMVQEQPQAASGDVLPEPGVCGQVFINRVFGGTETKITDMPWTALILYDKGFEVAHHCGGSLINNRYVLTAAHCIRSSIIPEEWKAISVRLGEWDTSTNNDCQTDMRGVKTCSEPHVDISIEKIIIYSNYVPSSRNQHNDIALLRLARRVNYTTYIRPICLPLKASLRRISYDEVKMDIAGWGLTERGEVSTRKMRAAVPGISLIACQRLYGRNSMQVHLENSQICAGGEMGVDSCNGDSGGGLIALDGSNKSQMYQYIAGVISFGPTPCGLKGWPGVYTRVSYYIDWIQENLEP